MFREREMKERNYVCEYVAYMHVRVFVCERAHVCMRVSVCTQVRARALARGPTRV